jgi:hypothetical protein
LIELKRTSRFAVQVVKINAELLHFHSIPLAPESTIGGIDLIGAKSATQASVKNATMSKGLFIAILPRCVQIRCFFDPRYRCYQALVSICLREQGKWLRQWANCFMVAWPTKPLHKIATAIRDADWRDLDGLYRSGRGASGMLLAQRRQGDRPLVRSGLVAR